MLTHDPHNVQRSAGSAPLGLTAVGPIVAVIGGAVLQWPAARMKPTHGRPELAQARQDKMGASDRAPAVRRAGRSSDRTGNRSVRNGGG